MKKPLTPLYRRLGYTFNQPDLLVQALTHRSANRKKNNERLEFLGDAQLGFMVALWLFEQFPLAAEGQLTRMRATLVRGATLAEVAKELGLGEYLVLGSGEMKSGGHRRTSILADALEAVIGAILLDSDESTCHAVVKQWLSSRLKEVSPEVTNKDPKTQLQEWLQARQLALPTYTVVATRGNAHDQEFDLECILPHKEQRFGATGTSRRRAEQSAAKQALTWLQEQKND